MKRHATLIRSTAVVAGLAMSVAGGGAAVAATTVPRGDRPIHSLVTAGTISVAQALEVKLALVSSRPTDHPKVRDAVLDSLVSSGTITRAQGDAILAAEKPHKLRGLLLDGTLTFAQAQAIHSALKSARTEHVEESTARRAEVLSRLVTDGSLTQAQSDAIASAMTAAKVARHHQGNAATADSQA